MIIPWLKGILSWEQAPLTWAILLTNLLVFMMTYDPGRRPQRSHFDSEEAVVLTGKMYDQYLTSDLELKSREDLMLLGSRGLRDPEFLKQAKEYKFHGDEIAIAEWKTRLHEFEREFEKKNSHMFGLLTEKNRPLTWITYQFMHAGWIHLFSNMILLLIFGGACEALLGSGALAIIYLLGGIGGGLGFLWMSPQTVAPMIGASGFLSAVMAAYAVTERKKRIAYFYFLSPIQGYFGLIYLPTLFIFPLCFIADLANFLATPVELGSGIAYTAHIGGMVSGMLLGAAYTLIQKSLQKIHASRSYSE